MKSEGKTSNGGPKPDGIKMILQRYKVPGVRYKEEQKVHQGYLNAIWQALRSPTAVTKGYGRSGRSLKIRSLKVTGEDSEERTNLRRA